MDAEQRRNRNMQFPWILANREKRKAKKKKKIRSRDSDAGTFWRPPHEPIWLWSAGPTYIIAAIIIAICY